jgi:hypothetical protein
MADSVEPRPEVLEREEVTAALHKHRAAEERLVRRRVKLIDEGYALLLRGKRAGLSGAEMAAILDRATRTIDSTIRRAEAWERLREKRGE